MKVDFDKQIDTILRDLAKENSFTETSPISHLDADELSAFAENVLPAKARLRAMEHLADCSNCRKILTTFFSLNPEAESETIHEEVKTIAAIPPIPWYRQLFAFPTISYAMGALALVLTGMIGFLVLQSTRDSGQLVSKTNEPTVERTKGPSGISSDGDSQTFESYSANSAANSVSTAANSTSAVAPANSSANAPGKPLPTPASAANSNSAAVSGPPEKLAESADRDAKSGKEEVMTKGGRTNDSPAVSQPSAPVNERSQADDMNRQQVMDQNVARNQNNVMMPDGESRRGAPPVPRKKSAPSREDESAGGETSSESALKKDSANKPVATKNIGDKTFRSENRGWVDSAYKGGNLTTVKRGTDDYKKLDSNLRSITDSLGGTVIIVWKNKNYKIQ